jgi:outer membrane protein OmpA-like peptidoglycan-associated protein
MPINCIRLAVFLLLTASSLVVSAQQYYVIIGSFNNEIAAAKFASSARQERYEANIVHNRTRSFYYVYTLRTSDRKLATEKTIQLQRTSGYSDAWLYTETDDSANEIITVPSDAVVTPEPAAPPIPEPVKVATPPAKDPETGPALILETAPRREPASAAEAVEIPEVTGDEEPAVPVKARGKFFMFQLTNSTGETVQGKVYNVDPSQSRDLATYAANKRVDVLRPSIPGTPITIVCEIFGYKEAVVIMDYADPGTTSGIYQNQDGVWVVPLTLEPLRKGDISVMYDVTFYKDAIIMTPASEGELEELASMMKANPNYKIKIHGHTNGNEKNLRIITPGSAGYYFGMSRTSSVTGSAKDLSRMRAEAIRSYLIEKGIAKNRIDTYAWGGTAMLAKSGTSAGARLNNRIEIEILAD